MARRIELSNSCVASSRRDLISGGSMMKKAHKPSDFLADRRKVIIEKALERRKKDAQNKLQQGKMVGPWPPLQKPFAPTAPR